MLLFLPIGLLSHKALWDAIKTDSNLITQEVVWEVAITEKNRDFKLWHYTKHTGIFCVCMVVPVSNYMKKKRLYNWGKMSFPGWVDKLYYLSMELLSGILMCQTWWNAEQCAVCTGKRIVVQRSLLSWSTLSTQSLVFVLKENTTCNS